MNLEFHGFAPIFPIWLIWIVVAFVVMLSWYTYRGYTSFKASTRSVFIALRMSALGILILLLLNPMLELRKESDQKPKVQILIDNSLSMSVEKGFWAGRNSLDSLHVLFDPARWTDLELSFFTFGRVVENISQIQDQTLSESATDLALAVNHFAQNEQFDAYFLISDGITTAGRDPALAARSINSPVHTVITGDSTRYLDIVLTDIESPERAFTGQTASVLVYIRNDGLPNEPVLVRLSSEGSLIDEIALQTGPDRSTQQVSFQIPLLNAGLKRYEVNIPSHPLEWTDQNNSARFSIDIQDGRSRILYLALDIHPDVGFMRSILSEEPSFDVQSLTWIGNDRFAEGRLPTRRDTLDLLILHGIRNGLPESLANEIRSLTDQLSTVLLVSPSSDQNQIARLFNGPTSIETVGTPTLLPYQIATSPAMTGHPILDLPAIDMARSPFISGFSSGFAGSSVGETILFAMNRQGLTTTPLLNTITTGNRRRSAILFSDFYQWGLQPEVSYRRWMEQVLVNTVTWTLANPQDDTFLISPLNFDNETGIPISFSAQVNDAAGNPESRAEVRVQISDGANIVRSYTMRSLGQGRYDLSIPPLPQGEYSYEASATREQLDLGSRNGTFTVGTSTIELINTVRDDALMQQISSLSGGQHFDFRQKQDIELILANIQSKAIRQVTNIPLQASRNPIWFVVLLLLLGSEWLLRKKYALP
jgi:hypothetical protein